jgi:anti-sigma factor RsiW
MTHAEIIELLGAYALDAVSPEEALEIEQHLADCPRCRVEVADHREVAGVLGNLSGTAPAGLWDRIADQLALGSDQPGSAQAVPGEPGSGQPGAPAPVIAIGSVQPRHAVSPGARRSRDRAGGVDGLRGVRGRNAMFTVAASVAIVLAVVVGALSAKVVHLDHQVSALSNAVLNSGVSAQAAAAELQPGHVIVNLTSSNSTWSARLVLVPDGEGFLLPGKMPALGAGQTFQAWALLKNGELRSLGVIGRSGSAMQLESPMTELLVNTEPDGGTSQPTTAPFLSGKLPKSF